DHAVRRRRWLWGKQPERRRGSGDVGQVQSLFGIDPESVFSHVTTRALREDATSDVHFEAGLSGRDPARRPRADRGFEEGTGEGPAVHEIVGGDRAFDLEGGEGSGILWIVPPHSGHSRTS